MCFSIPVQFVTLNVVMKFRSGPNGSRIGVQLPLKMCPPSGIETKHPIQVSVLLVTSRLASKLNREVKVPEGQSLVTETGRS